MTYAAILNVASTEMLFDGMPSTAAAAEVRRKVDLQFHFKARSAPRLQYENGWGGVAELGVKVLVAVYRARNVGEKLAAVFSAHFSALGSGRGEVRGGIFD